MRFDLMHPADQIVTIMERIYGYGMTTTSGGNLSILDENGDIWITPGGIDKGSLTREDIMRVTPAGEIIGKHKPSVELPFHSMLYKRRPDVRAVLHAHPPALVAFSLIRESPDTWLMPNAQLICGKVPMAAYEVPGSEQLGKNIADQFTYGINTVLLENHGVVVAERDLFKAFMCFETLDFSARTEISARRIGTLNHLSEENVLFARNKQYAEMDEFVAHNYTSYEKESRATMCRLIRRSYDQRLFTSTQGTFSQRIDESSFIITPYGKDRKYLEPEDLVRIEQGRKELGKVPSRSVKFHQAVYERYPGINSVLISQPPNIMAFAISNAHFDSRTIPESYIMLRDVKRMPFGSTYLDTVDMVNAISMSSPAVIVENDCAVVVGDSLLNAFDRLEVLDYSANAIISTHALGPIVAINDQEVLRINEAFHLT